MALWILLLFFYSFLCSCDRTTADRNTLLLLDNNIDPDERRNVSQLISSKGYPVEEHTVQTDDGYLLTVLRIPHGKTRSFSRTQNGVVLLIHGILGDSTNFVVNFPHQSLGFVLPDAGYDTWILNTRGCTYSKRHVVYTTHQQQFWNFSFDQVAQYDVPATIDYILDTTREKDLYIIGHSQGTTATFAMLSDQPEYNDKVRLLIALAPLTTAGHITSAARLLVPFVHEIAFVVNLVSGGEILGNERIFQFFRSRFCGLALAKEFCEAFVFAVGGMDRNQLNQTRTGTYFATFPSGSSIKSFVHYAQLVKSKTFRKYDYYGHNLEYYNQEEPPEYDLSRITTPVALIWSSNDKIAVPADIDFLRRQLNSLVFDYEIPYPHEHFDFVIAMNTFTYINEPILQLLRQY